MNYVGYGKEVALMVKTYTDYIFQPALYRIEIINVVFVFICINELPSVGCLRSSQ